MYTTHIRVKNFFTGSFFVLQNFLSFKKVLNVKDVYFVECTEVCFVSFLSGEFTTMAVINPPEKKLAKSTSMDWHKYKCTD